MPDEVQGWDTSIRDTISKGRFVQGAQPRNIKEHSVGNTSVGDTPTLHPRTVNFAIKKQLNTNFYNGHRVPGFFSSRPNWDLPHPFTCRRVCPSLVPGGSHSLAGEGVGDPSSDEGTDTVVL